MEGEIAFAQQKDINPPSSVLGFKSFGDEF